MNLAHQAIAEELKSALGDGYHIESQSNKSDGRWAVVVMSNRSRTWPQVNIDLRLDALELRAHRSEPVVSTEILNGERVAVVSQRSCPPQIALYQYDGPGMLAEMVGRTVDWMKQHADCTKPSLSPGVRPPTSAERKSLYYAGRLSAFFDDLDHIPAKMMVIDSMPRTPEREVDG